MAIAEPMSDVSPGILANNYMQVMMLQTALSRSESNLTTVPRLFSRIIREASWREWMTPEGRHVKWNAADFRQFLTSKRPNGCETPIDIIERTLRGTDAWESFQELVRGKPGGANNPDGLGGWSGKTDKDLVNRNNITVDKIDHQDVIPFDPISSPPKRDYSREARTGTSVSYALRRLKSNGRDDLLDKVKAGELSATAAMIEAGFRRVEFMIPIEPQMAARRILNRFQGEALVELIRVLANHAEYDLTKR